MNQFGPQWDTRPPHPTDYRPETPGPYSSPPPLDPFPHKPRRGGVLVWVGALAGLTIFGLWVAATTDRPVVPVPNSGISSTYDPGLYTPEPTNTRYTPNTHKPGPAVDR